MKFLLAGAVVSIILAGCAAQSAHQTISADLARSLGCNPQDVRERADRLHDQRDNATQTYVPKVGWTACDLIAHNGEPNRINGNTGHGYSLLDFRYDSGTVTIEQHGDDDEWVVTQVRW